MKQHSRAKWLATLLVVMGLSACGGGTEGADAAASAAAPTAVAGTEPVATAEGEPVQLTLVGERTATLADSRTRSSSSYSGNPVQAENAKSSWQGVTDDWQIAAGDYAANREIEGYASLNSVNRGDSIKLYVNVKDTRRDPWYAVNVYRMGWYGGKGGRRIFSPIYKTSSAQAACPMVDAVTKTIECNWRTSVELDIPRYSDPTVAMSGVYLAKLTTARGKSSYIVFVVRDDSRKGDFLFQTSVTTYAAYNTWGGYSFYKGPASDPDGRTFKASFNRPYANDTLDHTSKRSLMGSGEFLEWEVHAVRFLERNGYNVLYSTNLDTHTQPERLKQFRGFLSVGHDEYWSRGMYNAVEGARNAGVNLAFLGANNAYWAVRLEPSSRGQALRSVVTYKFSPELDPLTNTIDSTVRWREPPLNRPEAALLGVQYGFNTVDLDMVIDDCSSWICNGTGLKTGDRLTGLLGYEVDGLVPGVSPAGIVSLASSPYDVNGQAQIANMTYYTHTSGAGVFSTGSMQWNWGLDAFAPFPERANPAAQILTRNVLNRYLVLPKR